MGFCPPGWLMLPAVFLAVAPGLPTQGNVVAAVLTVVFGFFFELQRFGRQVEAFDHPWVQEYFHGPRGRAAQKAKERA